MSDERTSPVPADPSRSVVQAEDRDWHRQAVFILQLHWGVVLLAPILSLLSGRESPVVVWYVLGFFVVFTAALQATVNARPDETQRVWLGFVILLSDLVLVTVLVWARGGLATDSYHFYYLVIVGASILFGVRESIGFALAAGTLYGIALWFAAGGLSLVVVSRLLIRTVYFLLTGVAAAYLSAQERRHRVARAETQKLLADLQEAHTQLKMYAREMSQRAVTDGLTGLYNHTYFHRRLEEELRRSERYNRPVSVLLLDLDDFKDFNDSHGHLQGDRVLADVARVLLDSVRRVDIACRYGGEEFAFILPETDDAAAFATAERVRCAIEAAGRPASGQPPDLLASLTVSVGVATYPIHAGSRIELVEAADRALYVSKRRGKNVVTTLKIPDDPPAHAPA